MSEMNDFLPMLDDVQRHLENNQLDQASKLINYMISTSITDKASAPITVITKTVQIAQNHNQLLHNHAQILYQMIRFARQIAVFSTNNQDFHVEDGHTNSIIYMVNELTDNIHKFFKLLVKPSYPYNINSSPYLIFAELDIIYHLIQEALYGNSENDTFEIRNLYSKAINIIQGELEAGGKSLQLLADQLNDIICHHKSYKIYYVSMDIMSQITCCPDCSDYQRQIAYYGLEVNYDSSPITKARSFRYFWKKFADIDNKLKTACLQTNIIIQKWLNDMINILKSSNLPINVQENVKLDICEAANLDHPFIGHLLHDQRRQIQPYLADDIPIKLKLLLSPEEIENSQPSKLEINPSLPRLPVIINIPPCDNLLPRERYVDELYENLEREGQCQITQASTNGMVGVGKSSIAFLYAHKYREDYDLIRWLHAETEASLQYELIMLAKELISKGIDADSNNNKKPSKFKIPFKRYNNNTTPVAETADIEKEIESDSYDKNVAVRYWLNEDSKNSRVFQDFCDEKMVTVPLDSEDRNIDISEKLINAILTFIISNYRCLLIYDNADNRGLVQQYLPKKSSNCHIIVTSRNKGWSTNNNEYSHIEVGTFTREESIYYLLQDTNSDDEKSANAIAGLVSDLPLTLAEAAGYIRHTGLKLDDYLRKLEYEQQDLWKQKFGPAYYRKYIETVDGQFKLSEPLTHITAWTLTFTQLLNQHPVAEYIMTLITYISADKIADSLLYGFCQQQDPNITKGELNEAILALIDYGILHMSDDTGNYYDTHRMIQHSMQDYILKIVSIEVSHKSEDLTYPEGIVLSRILTYLTVVIKTENCKESAGNDIDKDLMLLLDHVNRFGKHLKKNELLQYQLPCLEGHLLNLSTKYQMTDKAKRFAKELMMKIDEFRSFTTESV